MHVLKKARAVLGISIVAALAMAMGCAATGDPAVTGEEGPVDEALQSIDPEPFPRSGCLVCTTSGNTATGRQWGQICLTKVPGTCLRQRDFGEAPRLYPSCHERGRDGFGCVVIIDG